MGSAFAAWMWRREREVKNTCLATQRSYCLSFASPSMHHIDTAIYLYNYSLFDCPKTNLGTANRGLPRGYIYLRDPPIGCLPESQGSITLFTSSFNFQHSPFCTQHLFVFTTSIAPTAVTFAIRRTPFAARAGLVQSITPATKLTHPSIIR